VILSIIIINYKTGLMTNECINSIKSNIQSVPNEIIVVDNNSNDDSPELIKSVHGDVKIVRLHENLGYGTAVNEGVKDSNGQFLLFLNSDILITQDYAKDLVEFYSNHNVGIIGIKLLKPGGKVQKTFGYFPLPVLIVSNELSWLRKINHRYFKKYAAVKSCNPNTQKVDWITGAFMFLSKKNYDKIGGFDENIFMYYEDVDICRRASNLGLNNYFISEFAAEHRHEGTINSLQKASYNKHKIIEKESAITYLQKYYPEYLKTVKFALKLVFINKYMISLFKLYVFYLSQNRRTHNSYKLNTSRKILSLLKGKR
jgi:GT2 family glycosyltransferase